AGRAPRHPIRRSQAGARGRRVGASAAADHGRWRAARRDADGAGRHGGCGSDLSQSPCGRRHDDARVQDQLLRGREIGDGARGSHALAPRPTDSGLADARDRRIGPAAVAHDPDTDGPDLVAPRCVPRRNSVQPTARASTANANDGVYEPVMSYTKPASAGPTPAPLRHPSPTTLMIVASAARPNTSETALTNVLSAPEAPRPKSNSTTTTVHVGRPINSAASAPHWMSRHTRMVA